MHQCKKCKKPMNPVEVMLSSKHGVCGECSRREHEKATGGSNK